MAAASAAPAAGAAAESQADDAAAGEAAKETARKAAPGKAATELGKNGTSFVFPCFPLFVMQLCMLFAWL